MEENTPTNHPEEQTSPINEPALYTPSGEELMVPTETTTEAEPQPVTSNLQPATSNEQPATSNLQPATDMEVHHHAHDPAAPHHKKNWKSYFWEFLMLFLAVFCGFLAEYQLEHLIENQREEKYVQLLIEDLKTDTTHLAHYINERQEKRMMMDSLVLLLSTGMHKQFGNATYYFARHVFNNPPFVSTDGTLQQLKNAGNLRLIKNETIINNILAYDAGVKDLKEWDDADTRMRTTFREIGGTVFDAYQLYKVLDSTFEFVRPTTNPQLITDNPAAINNVTFQISYISLSSMGNMQRASALKAKAERLIDFIKREYHLE
jgi:hypothetical protein